ncbi:MAG TPA: archaetidylserine decarboxylase [Burkholderiales bacterium]|nr:archaetidylserine decarboxylase [Burkholderiales bacterium]
MTVRTAMLRILQQEDINFLVTNRIPRQLMTRFMGWFSKIEQPLVARFSIAIWRRFADLRLHEAKKTSFSSLHDCFIRELKPGARPIDPDPAVLVSPCDAIVGASGKLDGVQLLQAKGFPYTLNDLIGDPEFVATYRNGSYATLRITSTMYHRFHAPHDGRVNRVTYFSGDTWNVNPIALNRVERLFCKNERALIRMRLEASGQEVLLVPVAAVLVASIRLHFLDVLLHLRYRGPNVMTCDARFAKGQEMGWFQHGSTIIVFAPPGFAMHEHAREGEIIRAGEPLMRLPADG